MKLLIVLLALLILSSCMLKTGDEIQMKVYQINGDLFTLENLNDGNLWAFQGCPLVPTPAVGDTVLIDVYTRQWIVE